MSEFDAAGRLAQGRPAVEVVEDYVEACHRLGYQHGDLTAHAGQVFAWYGSEDGLDLGALDDDHAALTAAAAAAETAARMHSALVGDLSQAWSGRGAAAAGEFVWRSGRAGADVSAALGRAAEALAALRNRLWHAVDAKVDTVQQIDARHQSQQAEWLAAAKTVTTGAGDVAAASELVDLQLKPFVQGDIESEWVGAMRSATATIGAAYDTAVAAVSAGPAVVFEVPGELGPRPDVSRSGAAPVVSGASAAPVAAAAPAAVMPAAVVPAAISTPDVAKPQAFSTTPPGGGMTPASSMPTGDTAPLASGAPSMGELGGAPSSLGGGVGGFGQQLADLIGSLFGSADVAGTDPAALDDLDAADDEPVDPEDGDDPEDEDDPEDPEDEEDSEEEETVDAEAQPVGEESDANAEPMPDEAPADTGVPPPAEPAPPVPPPVEPTPLVPPAVPDALAVTPEATPCEIAADELPQVGE